MLLGDCFGNLGRLGKLERARLLRRSLGGHGFLTLAECRGCDTVLLGDCFGNLGRLGKLERARLLRHSLGGRRFVFRRLRIGMNSLALHVGFDSGVGGGGGFGGGLRRRRTIGLGVLDVGPDELARTDADPFDLGRRGIGFRRRLGRTPPLAPTLSGFRSGAPRASETSVGGSAGMEEDPCEQSTVVGSSPSAGSVAGSSDGLAAAFGRLVLGAAKIRTMADR